MKFSMPFNLYSRYSYKVDQLIINYHKDLKALDGFLEDHKNQRIILAFNSNNQIDKNLLTIISNYIPVHSNLCVRIPTYDQAIVDQLQELKIPFFTNDYVASWDELYTALHRPVTDIYVVEELGFVLDKVAAAAHSKNIKVRVFPNVAQSRSEIPAIKRFFIRPEDLSFYEPYVDVYEFYTADAKINTDVFYEIYSQDQKWFGDLNEIIIGLKTSFDSRCILNEFGKQRTTCDRTCFKGGHCQICDRIYEVSKLLKEADLMTIPPIDQKEESEYDEDAYEAAKQHTDELLQKMKTMLQVDDNQTTDTPTQVPAPIEEESKDVLEQMHDMLSNN